MVLKIERERDKLVQVIKYKQKAMSKTKKNAKVFHPGIRTLDLSDRRQTPYLCATGEMQKCWSLNVLIETLSGIKYKWRFISKRKHFSSVLVRFLNPRDFPSPQVIGPRDFPSPQV